MIKYLPFLAIKLLFPQDVSYILCRTCRVALFSLKIMVVLGHGSSVVRPVYREQRIMVLNRAQVILGAIEFFEKRVILGVIELHAFTLQIRGRYNTGLIMQGFTT